MQSFGSQLISPVGWLEVLKALLAAFALGQALAWVYEQTYQGVSYSRGFAQTLALVSISGCAFVLSIGRSVYAGLGLLGVLSIVRFRANLKAPRDLVFIMASATLGVAAGIDALMVAVGGCLAFVLASLYLHHGPLGSQKRWDGVLRFRMPSDGSLQPRVTSLLDQHCRRSALLSLGEAGAGGGLQEHTYQVKFHRNSDRGSLVERLREDVSAQDLRLMLQEAHLEY